MDPDQIGMIILFVFLILLSAFYSMSETSFLSLNEHRIKTLAEEGNKRAGIVLDLLIQKDKLLSSILVGNNLVNIAASSLTTSFIISVFGNESKGVAIATGFVTLVILIFGEITPKSLATQYSEKITFSICRIIKANTIIFTPIVIILNGVANIFIKLFGGDTDVEPTLTEDVLKTIVSASNEEGALEDGKKEMIHNVFEFGDTEIREIMTPRIHVATVANDVIYKDLLHLFKETQFSRIPVYNDSVDEIIGVLHIKDLLLTHVDTANFDVSKYMREAFFVYEFNQISTVFEKMRKNHLSMAVVVDEYGVMSGIVTLEDIVEEIVGEIDDEYDDVDESLIIDLGNNVYLVDGSLNIDEINDACQTSFDSEDFESIGGLVLGEVDGSPELNQVVKIDDVLFTIIAIEKNRITRLRLELVSATEEEDDEEKHK